MLQELSRLCVVCVPCHAGRMPASDCCCRSSAFCRFISKQMDGGGGGGRKRWCCPVFLAACVRAHFLFSPDFCDGGLGFPDA